MMVVSDAQFASLIDNAMRSLPREHMRAVQNVAIVYADEPDAVQAARLKPNETLLGLYEGVPLARRQGVTSYGPDKITLFKLPLCARSHDLAELKENIRHTLWHEIAHYFGLDHPAISDLERRAP